MCAAYALPAALAADRTCARANLKTLFRPRAHANGFCVCLPTHTYWCALAWAQNLQASGSVKQGAALQLQCGKC